MKGDDYMQGRHFWTHFWCGLVVGGILGARIGWGLFESGWAKVGCGAAIALALATALGYLGDPLWRWLIGHWH
jgi:hypothetical protein